MIKEREPAANVRNSEKKGDWQNVKLKVSNSPLSPLVGVFITSNRLLPLKDPTLMFHKTEQRHFNSVVTDQGWKDLLSLESEYKEDECGLNLHILTQTKLILKTIVSQENWQRFWRRGSSWNLEIVVDAEQVRRCDDSLPKLRQSPACQLSFNLILAKYLSFGWNEIINFFTKFQC